MTCAEGRLLPFFLVPAVRCVVERKVRGPLPIEPVVRGNALAVLLFFGGLFSVFQFWPGGWNAFEAAEVPAGALVGEAFFLSEQAGGRGLDSAALVGAGGAGVTARRRESGASLDSERRASGERLRKSLRVPKATGPT